MAIECSVIIENIVATRDSRMISIIAHYCCSCWSVSWVSKLVQAIAATCLKSEFHGQGFVRPALV